MSSVEQSDFVTTLVKAVAAQKSPADRGVLGSTVEAFLGYARLQPSLIAQALAPLLADSDDQIASVAQAYLVNVEAVSLPNGTRTSDFSVFIPALNEEGGRNQLIAFLFKRSGIEVATWFAKSTFLSEAESTHVMKSLETGRNWEEALRNHAREAFPSKTEQERQLAQWLADDSWIVQQYAKSLLRKYRVWETPALREAAGRISLPIDIHFMDDSNALREKTKIIETGVQFPVRHSAQDASSKEREGSFGGWGKTISVLAVILTTIWILRARLRG